MKERNRIKPWQHGEILSDEEFRQVRYATRSWLLQERVPLSFVQARIFLHEEKPESLEDIAEKFNLPIEKIRDAEPIIRKKVEAAEKERDIFFGHTPIYPDDCQQQ